MGFDHDSRVDGTIYLGVVLILAAAFLIAVLGGIFVPGLSGNVIVIGSAAGGALFGLLVPPPPPSAAWATGGRLARRWRLEDPEQTGITEDEGPFYVFWTYVTVAGTLGVVLLVIMLASFASGSIIQPVVDIAAAAGGALAGLLSPSPLSVR
jgi:hypothetical protein